MSRKLLAMLLAALLVLAVTPLAAQAEYVKTINAGGTLNLRQGAGKTYGVAGYVSDGDQIILTGNYGIDSESYKWVEVTVVSSGKTGFIKEMYVSTTPSTAKIPNKSIHIPGGYSIILRAGPGTGYAIVDYVFENDKVTVLSGGSVWAKVKLDKNGNVGYIKHKYIYGYSGGGSGGGGSSGGGYYGSATVTTKYATSGVNVRTGPGTGYGVVTVLGRGAGVTVKSKSGNWYRVSTSTGYEGYIYKDYLSFGGGGGGYTGAHTTAAVNLRTGPGTGYFKLTVVPKGTFLTILGYSGNWVNISYGGYTGYIYSGYVSY